MKKIRSLALVLSLAFTITACGQIGENESEMIESTETSHTAAFNERMQETEPADGAESSMPNAEEEIRMKAEFDFESKTVMLNSGYEMPINGLGTYSLHGEECINSVKTALSNGVRLIDTASAYGNEDSVGEAVRNSGIAREEIFVITKLYPNQFADPEAAIEEALTKLDIGYIDLCVFHGIT